MDLPATLPMQLHLRSSTGRRGEEFALERDQLGLGINSVTTRTSWRQPVVACWSYAGVADKTWPSYAAMRAAMVHIRPEAVRQELAKYPRIQNLLEFPGNEPSKTCGVCSAAATVRLAKVGAFVAVNWRHEDQRYVQLCGDHRHLLDRPAELMKALESIQSTGATSAPDLESNDDPIE